ncbi:MBL fold metallo-hydrolase [Hyphomonas oceanitis]|uniref:MBL fold metallo-hydrolase n=1 Tax=Hyphomonas oceanitis TaxID=81033 RepID=UPI0030028EFD
MDGFQTKTPKRPNLDYPHGDVRPGLAEAIKVAPGIEWVSMPLPFSLKFINLWLIDDGDSWTIVDTGMPLKETRDAWKALLDTRVTPEKPLKRVMVTHMHPDHVGCAGWLCYKYGAELWMSRLEYTTCRMLVSDTGREAPQAGIDFYRRAGWNDAQIDNYKERFGGFGRGVSQMPDSFRRLADGDTLQMAGETWEVVMGNGHSPEHSCLYCPALNVVISGDQLLPRISSNVSVHPTEPEADPLLDWMMSCEKLLAHLPENVLVLPAHNEPFRGAHARLRHLIDGHETALSRLKGRMQKGALTVMDTFTSLFGRAIQPDEVGMASGEAIAHLNCMIHRGEVVRIAGEDGVDRYALA